MKLVFKDKLLKNNGLILSLPVLKCWWFISPPFRPRTLSSCMSVSKYDDVSESVCV